MSLLIDQDAEFYFSSFSHILHHYYLPFEFDYKKIANILPANNYEDFLLHFSSKHSFIVFFLLDLDTILRSIKLATAGSPWEA